jgi:hypothetical protein
MDRRYGSSGRAPVLQVTSPGPQRNYLEQNDSENTMCQKLVEYGQSDAYMEDRQSP